MFIPSTKYKLLECLSAWYPDDKALKRKSKKQLYAIYFTMQYNMQKDSSWDDYSID